MDAAYWRKGCSSLGRLRRAVLIAVGRGNERHCLMDVKEAIAAAAPRSETAVKPTRSRSEPHNSSDATACVCATAIAHSPHEQKGADDDDEDPWGVAEAAD